MGNQWSFSASATTEYCGNSRSPAFTDDDDGSDGDGDDDEAQTQDDGKNGGNYIYLFIGIGIGALLVAVVCGFVAYFYRKKQNMRVHDIDISHISKDIELDTNYA